MASDPKAEVEISAHSRGLAAKLREARAKFGNFTGELKKNVFGKDLIEKGFWGKAGAHMVGGLGATAVSAGVGFLVDQAKEAFNFEHALTRLQIASGKTPAFMREFAAGVREASNETGISAAKILAGARAYVALTGDMDGAAAASKQWARVAQATDSQVEDIAKTAAALKQQMRIDPSQMEAVFSALAVQGKEGAIELKDLAAQLSSIAPQWAEFGRGRGVEGVRELGAALQVVKRGFGGDAGETVTGLQSLLNALIKNAARFKGAGIKIFETGPDGKKNLRNVLDIVRDIGESKLAKDPTKLEKAMGRVEAYRAYLQLSQNRDVLNDLIEKSRDEQVIARDLRTYQESTAGKLSAAWETAKNKIAEAFTPERIERFVEALATAAEWFAKLVGFVSDLGDHLALDVDQVKVDAARQSIEGTNNTAEMTRRILGQELGVDLENMTPMQRMEALEKAKGQSDWARAARRGAEEKRASGDLGNSVTGKDEERARIAARREQDRRDAQGAGIGGFGKALGMFGLDPASSARALEDAVIKAAPVVGRAVADAIKEGGGSTIKADGTAIAKTVNNARVAGTRPGG